jgi:predicted nucleotidyltransferase
MTEADFAQRLQLTPSQLATLQGLLARHTPHAQAWAYGSRVTGGAHEGSDLDLVLRRADDLSRHMEGLDTLREALRDSSLPILVDVHDWAELPVSFRHEIERNHLELTAASIAA